MKSQIFADNLYSMKLGEGIDSDSMNFFIERVPGGWIYYDKSNNTSVFVPFNNEFQGINERT